METSKFFKIIIVLLILLNIGTLTFMWLNKPKPLENRCPHIADRELKEKPLQEQPSERIEPNRSDEAAKPEVKRKEHPENRERERNERQPQERQPEETQRDNPNEFIKQELNFNKEQERKFDILSNKHTKRETQIHDSLRGIKKNFFDLLSSTNDSKKEEYLNTLGALEKSRLRNNYDFFREVKKLCNEEQKNKLDEIFRDVLRMLSGPPKR